MSDGIITCPNCGSAVRTYKNPVPTVDVIIDCYNEADGRGIVLIKRTEPPLGWALPGGFIEYGESAEQAAVREVAEETALRVDLLGQFHVYSSPERDPRRHTLTIVFLARAKGRPVGGDDAKEAAIFGRHNLPEVLCFDHGQILADYCRWVDGQTGPQAR